MYRITVFCDVIHSTGLLHDCKINKERNIEGECKVILEFRVERADIRNTQRRNLLQCFIYFYIRSARFRAV